MRLPGFTGERSLYQSSTAYRSSREARADMVFVQAEMAALHATLSPKNPSITLCSACKASCIATTFGTAGFCADISTFCAGVTPLTVGTLTIPCVTLAVIACAVLAVEIQQCFEDCNELCPHSGGPSPGGGGSGGAPKGYCELHPDKCSADGTPIPDPGCEIWTTGGWYPQGGALCGGCCYSQYCPGKPLEQLGCQCGCV
jgi:hypothetical protein